MYGSAYYKYNKLNLAIEFIRWTQPLALCGSCMIQYHPGEFKSFIIKVVANMVSRPPYSFKISLPIKLLEVIFL